MRLFSPVRGLLDFSNARQLAEFVKRFSSGAMPTALRGHDVPRLRNMPTQSRGHGTQQIVRNIFLARPDLREAFPLGLTPQGRESFATWLFEHGNLDHDEIISYLQHAANDPAHGLAETWLLTPAWQEHYPDALTLRQWKSFKRAIAKQYSITARWIRQATLPAEHVQSPSPRGVNILAHFRYPSGLQEEALQYASALRAHGRAVSLRDAPVGISQETGSYLGGEVHPITLAKLGACESLDEQYPLTGWHPRPGVHRIACWSWELSTLPRHLAGKADLADEIWTPSEFCAQAVRQAFPEKTVTAMLPAVSLPKFEPLPRSHFGLPADRFLFLFAFDIGSVMERKNPLGLIDVFQKTFRSDDRAHLAIKVTRGSTRPTELARLKAAAGPNVTILDAVMPRGELTALMAGCDAYVSLHRAEGFGFTVAEAMLLGKATIATGYSAPVEFMTESTGYAVKYRLKPVGTGCEPYPVDAEWAEPDAEHAAYLMRFVLENKDAAKTVGSRAKEELPTLLSPTAAGRRMTDRLDAIRKEL